MTTTVELEKAEAMRRYKNRKSFRNILRTTAVASLCFLLFPTVMISLQAAGVWFYNTVAVLTTDRSVVFVIANVLVALIFVLSCDEINETSCSDTEPDLYDQYTSSSNYNNESTTSSCDTEPDLSSSAEEKSEDDDDDSKKQIVPAVTKGIYRRTKSEMKREVKQPVKEIRRTESAKERLSSEDEEVDVKAEAFIMENYRRFVEEEKELRFIQENYVVRDD